MIAARQFVGCARRWLGQSGGAVVAAGKGEAGTALRATTLEQLAQSPHTHGHGHHRGGSLLQRLSRPYSRITDGYCGTTILCVRKEGEVVLIGDGQVTAGHEVIKHHVRKVRRLGDSGVIGGFAGSTADALTLYERLENKLEEYPGQLKRASVELAKAWRTEKYLRRLDAVMLVADEHCMLEITGNGDVIEPDHGVIACGSGGTYAYAAALALMDVEGLSAMDVALKAMKIASDICIYTNSNFTIECIPDRDDDAQEDDGGKGDGEDGSASGSDSDSDSDSEDKKE